MNKILVTIIIATKNEEKNIGNCLKSINEQDYKNKEVIVVDNNSSDATKKIVERFSLNALNYGPERSAQRNYGLSKSKGDYILFLDADMKLSRSVISEAIALFLSDNSIGAVIIPEKSYGTSFWAEVKSYEKSFYVGDNSIEAPRFFKKKVLQKIGGYDDNLIAGEDWDLGNRVRNFSKVGRIKSYIFHNEGRSALLSILKKKFYYAKHISKYFKKYKNQNKSSVKFFLFRPAFFKDPKKLLSHPTLTIFMFVMLALEAGMGLLGYFLSKNEE